MTGYSGWGGLPDEKKKAVLALIPKLTSNFELNDTLDEDYARELLKSVIFRP